MSLLSRLVLAFLALVALTAAVGIVSYVVQSQIGEDVARLRPSRGIDLRELDLQNVNLEIEGFPDSTGLFVATDVSIAAGVRRPKLRGRIEGLDPVARTLRLYGVDIAVTPATQFSERGETQAAFEKLRPGQRIEVSASLTGDLWSARKIRTHGVKPSDQIKGTPTGLEPGGETPEILEFAGIRVSVPPRRGPSPQGALRQIELASRLSLQLQESRGIAQELVGASPAGYKSEAEPLSSAFSDASERLLQVEQEFERTLERCREGIGTGATLSRLHALRERLDTFRGYIDTLRTQAPNRHGNAQKFFSEVFEPFLQNQLLPLVYAHRDAAEEELARQVHGISERARTTTRVAFAGSAIAVVLAATLGFLTWRSIQAPLRSLHDAAVRIGRGDLTTRVSINSRDELGVLADAFNGMAKDLASTTVSVRELEDALRDREILLHEVHHRVKNNMQVISSLLAIQASEVDDPIAREKFEECQGRIRSMALIHDQLHGTADLSRLNLRGYLEQLVSQVLESFGSEVRFAVDVAGVDLEMDQALTCGLIVNELVTNVLKHARKADGPGEVRISLANEEEDRLALSVCDDGPGFPNGEWSNGGGIGFDLVQTLVKQLNGELEVGGGRGGSVRIVFDAVQPRKDLG
jgi:two-component sensor histidine kinase